MYMGLYMEKGYELRLCDFDRYGRIQPAALLDIFQDIATLQAASIQIGLEDMRRMGVLWVIVRMKYEIVREPHLHERVVASTWPHTLSRFSFLRDFALRSEEGEELAKATSEWVIVDADTHKFASIADYYHGPTDFCEQRSFDAKPKKITQVPGDEVEPVLRSPAYSEVDMNGHVNNAKYANYIVDALEPGPQGSIRTFQVDYRQEALEGQELFLRTAALEDGVVAVKGTNADGQVVFTCHVERG